jgi:hypothetical protein
MKPDTRKIKTARGRIAGYAASFGPIATAKHDTAIDASRACETETRNALDRLAQGTTIYRWQEHTYVVSPTVDGWQYWLDTFSSTYTCVCTARETRAECADSALAHLAANAWTYAADDDAFLSTLPERFHADLRKRFAYCREYKRLIDAGHTDQSARQVMARAV